jgi:hypothetical protein
MKQSVELKEGKLMVDFEVEQSFDKDGDGVASFYGKSVNHVELDPYELINEISKKDNALLALILKQINFKSAE